MPPFDLDNKEMKISEAAFMAGIRHSKKLFIQKACRWLQENAANFWESPCNPDKIVEQFKQAMQDGN